MKATAHHKTDKRELPIYPISEAARYLRIPASTIRWWVTGETGPKKYKPIICLPEDGNNLLSFINLTELHILDAIRRKHRIPLPKVRKALDFLTEHYPSNYSSNHLLAEEDFATDGKNLFAEKYGHLVNLSAEGQLAIRELLEAHLERIERDPAGIPVRLYPYVRKKELQEPRVVVIDPNVSFGRPSLVGTGIATAVIAERFRAGESLGDLAEDYGRRQDEIEEAIRCELYPEAA
jgi:uncharacterized protein (DUF433 family)